MDDATLFDQLLRAEDEAEADKILSRAGFGLENEAVWHPLGDMPNNRSVVTNQQTEPTAAFVEKIVNGIDALLMAESLRRRIDPKGPTAPGSMARAVQEFFDVPGGLLANLTAKEQTELAKKLHVVVVGAKANPSYLITLPASGRGAELWRAAVPGAVVCAELQHGSQSHPAVAARREADTGGGRFRACGAAPQPVGRGAAILPGEPTIASALG